MRFIAFVLALFASILNPALAQNAPFPPSPRQLVAVNPVTNKVYVANEAANSVTVLDQANNTTTTIPVGSRPQFIVVNPLTNRVYVNNGGAASLTVIDGATDTNLTPTPLATGTQGPMAINTETNVVYQVRMTSVATDEVTFINGNNNTWYTIATESFQPTALTINPVTNTLYVAHYGTGDVRVISGEYNNTVLHPVTFSIPAWSKPFAIAANSMTNRIYVITEDSRGPIGVIDGATNTPTWLTPAGGHAVGPKALAVNPVTNKIYAAFANEVIVIDGGNNSLTYVPVPTGGTASIAINYFTNKVYVSSDGGNLTVIDGFTNATTALSVSGGTISIGMNPMTNEIITGGGTIGAVDGVASTFIGVPPTTTINPLPGNSGAASGSITMSASNGFPNPLPVRGVYYQFDSIEGRWSLASGAGNGPWTAALSSLSSGSHTIYAFAAEAHVVPTDTGNGSSPLFGNITSYAFNVTAGGARVDVSSSKNPSSVGQSVTFTAAVSGSSGTPSGTVTFSDGSTPICSNVALASGSATCTTSALAAGARTINVSYSGNSTYAAASGSVTQTVNKLASALSVGSTPNPSNVGQSVTFTAAVTGSAGTPTGTVTFSDGSTAICSNVTLASGSATCTTSGLAAGARTINVSYSGNSTYATTSGSVTQTVNQLASTVTVGSTPNPSTAGQSVTITATVAGSGATPTGTVTFTDGATTLCSAVNLASGSATCTTSSLATGSRTITAAYSGNATYAPKSATVTQTVNAAPTEPAPATISSPANGATLAGASQAFTWNAAPRATKYQVWVGNTLGAYDIGYYPKAGTSATSTTVDGLPTDGRKLYVRLWSLIDGVYYSTDSTYVAASITTPGPAHITSPANGAVLAGASQLFQWNAATGATLYQVWVGNSVGAYDIGYYPKAGTSSTSTIVDGLPTDGRKLYVRLWSLIDGVYQSVDFTYTAATSAPAAPSSITSPANGATLAGATQLFEWNDAGATKFQLWVGNTPGAYDIGYFPAAGTTDHSVSVSGLPTDGRTLYVTLWSVVDGVYQSRGFTYVAAPR